MTAMHNLDDIRQDEAPIVPTPEEKAMRLTITTVHGEWHSIFHVVDADAPDAEQPAIIETFSVLEEAERYVTARRYPALRSRLNFPTPEAAQHFAHVEALAAAYGNIWQWQRTIASLDKWPNISISPDPFAPLSFSVTMSDGQGYGMIGGIIHREGEWTIHT